MFCRFDLTKNIPVAFNLKSERLKESNGFIVLSVFFKKKSEQNTIPVWGVDLIKKTYTQKWIENPYNQL